MTRRSLFVTTALPYANGPLHVGHIMEYIQADIWVRFQKMRGHAVHFVGAEDAHGAPIMIAAERAGKTPQQFIADDGAARGQYLTASSSASITGTRPIPPKTSSCRSRSTAP
jgi:methionyl-tRNA synthetase